MPRLVLLKKTYKPEQQHLKIDGCFDFSRLKRVIGTFNHKAQRVSGFIKRSEPSDRVREDILAIAVDEYQQIDEAQQCDNAQYPDLKKIALPFFNSTLELPLRFKCLLRWDGLTRKLWQTPDPDNDTSRHDWMLGLSCVEAGITQPEELAAILMRNPNGKYKRDGRRDYIEMTVRKLVEMMDNMKKEVGGENMKTKV
jgi:hypothetical protein